MGLQEYARKRDFKRTAEPKPKIIRRAGTQRFVIQKHAASHLHYDFRLEMDGTLKSWAVPKGIPYAKGEKRLAMQVEDHPVSYIDFEGTIPKGQYGGGTVMVWDRGTYEVVGNQTLGEGKLHFVLHGEKAKGEWYLVQMRGGKEWLLIRAGDDLKPVSKRQEDLSVISGRTMEQLSTSDQVWNSSKVKEAPKISPTRRLRSRTTPVRPAARFIEPMMARLVATAPTTGDWIYEVKFDGFRALATKSGADVQLVSRNAKDFSAKFPDVVAAVSELSSDDCIIDGEIVVLDEKGRSSFQLLQAYELGQQQSSLFYYAFDLLREKGSDLMDLPVEDRKDRLEKLLKDPPGGIRYSASLPGSSDALLKMARKLGLEGVIGKRRGSRYEAGQRTGAWVKIKMHLEQEMVIGGYTEPEGARQFFGALIVGYYEGKELCYAGKVGTGFSVALQRNLHQQFARDQQEACPFGNLPEKRNARFGQAITLSQMKRCHWLKPELVCQVRFAEWTRDGKLRQPVFLGLREDKDAREVVREIPK